MLINTILSDDDPFFSIPQTPCGSVISTNQTLRLPVNIETQLYFSNEVSVCLKSSMVNAAITFSNDAKEKNGIAFQKMDRLFISA